MTEREAVLPVTEPPEHNTTPGADPEQQQQKGRKRRKRPAREWQPPGQRPYVPLPPVPPAVRKDQRQTPLPLDEQPS